MMETTDSLHAPSSGYPIWGAKGQSLPAEGIFLRLDAGFPLLSVEVVYEGRSLACAERAAPADEALADLVGEVLREADCPPSALAGFLYHAGPGSLLGLRVAAMMIETWRLVWSNGQRLPVWMYHHAEALACSLTAGRGEGVTLISDARRKQWNVCHWDPSARRMSWSLLSTGELPFPEPGLAYLLPGSFLSQPAPEGWQNLPPAKNRLAPEIWWQEDLAWPVDRPEPLLLRRSSYATWSGQPRLRPDASQ